MHYLHRILVYIPDAICSDKDTTRAAILDAVISHARNTTEDFAGQVYDWREDDSAGRWSEVYPQHAYLAADNPEWFLEELEDVLRIQKGDIDKCFSVISQSVGNDLGQIIEGIWSRNSDSAEENGFNYMTSYYLRNIASLLHGDYRCDSCFYNTHDYTARLFRNDVESIRKSPDDWALVMFDYHY